MASNNIKTILSLALVALIAGSIAEVDARPHPPSRPSGGFNAGAFSLLSDSDALKLITEAKSSGQTTERIKRQTGTRRSELQEILAEIKQAVDEDIAAIEEFVDQLTNNDESDISQANRKKRQIDDSTIRDLENAINDIVESGIDPIEIFEAPRELVEDILNGNIDLDSFIQSRRKKRQIDQGLVAQVEQLVNNLPTSDLLEAVRSDISKLLDDNNE